MCVCVYVCVSVSVCVCYNRTWAYYTVCGVCGVCGVWMVYMRRYLNVQGEAVYQRYCKSEGSGENSKIFYHHFCGIRVYRSTVSECRE